MWNNFGDLTKKLAEKAAAAAENIEGQLNNSVGANPESLAEMSTKFRSNDVNVDRSGGLSAIADDEDPFGEDDDFYADDDSFNVDMHDDNGKTETPALDRTSDDIVENNHNNAVAEDLTPQAEEPTQQTTGEAAEVPMVHTSHQQEDNYFDEMEQNDHAMIEEEGLYDDDEEDEDIGFDSGDPVEILTGDKTAEEPLTIQVHQAAFVECAQDQYLNETPLHKNQSTVAKVAQDADPITIAPSLVTEQVVTADDDKVEFPTLPGSEVSIKVKIEETVDTLQPMEEVQPEEDREQLSPEDEDISLNPTRDSEQLEYPTTIQLDSSSDGESVYVSKEEALGNSFEMGTLRSQVEDLENQLTQRETQLESKSMQITTMLEIHEQEKKALEGKVKETKEEAKKRISKAKEKVDDMKFKIAEANARANSAGSSSSDQEEIIVALREEGEKLAKKQSEMEYLVREARSDMRDLKKELESERTAKVKAEAKITELESELKETKEELRAANQKGGLADKLDSDLLAAREEREKNASIILGLEAGLKESKSRNSELQKEMEETFKDKVSQLEQETASIRNEKDTILHDLESKLRTSERESNLREDSLRHEVSELRKRWQDAVRRCDALSIDLQQSSAPLMRQLESTERQSRSRAAAWAELESKLRNDLEENIIDNEKLTKDKNEMEAELKKISRSLQGKDSELVLSQSRVTDLSKTLTEVSTKLESTVAEYDTIKLEFTNLEQMMKDNESNQNLEMMNAIQATEERCNDQIDSLEVEVRQERDKRLSLEENIQEMMDETSDIVHNQDDGSTQNGDISKKHIRNLGSKANQADILQDTLLGLDPNDGDDNDHEESNGMDSDQQQTPPSTSESFAFIEQLSQALKAAKSERDTLRKQLDESEERRGVLENESVANQEATKTLPLLESKVSQLTREAMQKDMEIQALQEDINEVRDMYRSQLSALLDGPLSGVQNGAQSSNSQKNRDTKPIVPPTSFGGMRTF